MTAARVWPMAAVAVLVALLLFALLFLLLTRDSAAAVELTGDALAEPAAAESAPAEPPVVPESLEPLRVYVAGAVQKPGVYTLNPGDRLADAIAAAGGIAATADLSPVNLALKVKDEGRYLIPDIAARPAPAMPAAGLTAADLTHKTANLLTGELSGVTETVDPAANPAGDGEPNPAATAAGAGSQAGGNNGEPAAGLLDLNTATDRQLETLPGIGPARARAIIAHREQHGPFVAAEELTAVSGIGSGLYGNLQGMITVAPTTVAAAPTTAIAPAP